MDMLPISKRVYAQTIPNANVPIMMSQAMGPSIRQQNKEYLLKVILNQLGLTDEDLEKEPHIIKSIVRDSNIDKVLEENNLPNQLEIPFSA
jgi:hypothetical protein